MAITGLSVATGATVSTTGGTAVAVAKKNSSSLDTLTLAATADTLSLQRTFAFTVKAPKVDTSNPTGYTQARRQMVISIPKDLGSGKINVDKLTVEISTGLNTTSADILDYRKFIAQALIDSDLDGFWVTQLLD
jgi:hypothetical protein